MVVEDNALNLKLVRTLLRLAGYEVLEVESGEAAVTEAAERKPDLILMDIQLPGIDGIEACTRLKSDPRTAAIPIVALTSYAMPGDDRKASDAGCVGYITKPIDTKTFAGTVGRFLSDQ
jgi:CheY-like chemotaxis protein